MELLLLYQTLFLKADLTFDHKDKGQIFSLFLGTSLPLFQDKLPLVLLSFRVNKRLIDDIKLDQHLMHDGPQSCWHLVKDWSYKTWNHYLIFSLLSL